jgi:uncharacterized damage-inducible protein DinB
MDLLDRLLEHDHWATGQLLEASRGLSEEQLGQDVDVGHRTLGATFGHMIVTVGFWISLMAGERPETEWTGERTLDALVAEHERGYAAFADFARRARDEGRLDETYIDHYDARKSIGGTVLSVVLHNEEHRAEVRHILVRLGMADVPEVDHGLWDYLMLNE